MAARIGTDEVSNQSPPYQDVDLFGSDTPLREAVAANGAGGEAAALAEFGRHWGSAAMFERAKLANENPPRLDREVVEFHPAYHQFMAESVREGLARVDMAAGRHARRRAGGGRARGALLHGGAGRERAHVPDHHDAGFGRGARGGSGIARGSAAENRRPASTTRASGRGRKNPG